MNLRRGVRLAVDWGAARIGVAACDPGGVLAYPVGTVAAGAAEFDGLLALVAEYEPIEVLVGLPRRLQGDEGPAAQAIRAKAEQLADRLGGPSPSTPDALVPAVRLVDERLTTVTARKRLQTSGRNARQQRGVIDAAAAVAILEGALDAERAQGVAPGELVIPQS